MFLDSSVERLMLRETHLCLFIFQTFKNKIWCTSKKVWLHCNKVDNTDFARAALLKYNSNSLLGRVDCEHKGGQFFSNNGRKMTALMM